MAGKRSDASFSKAVRSRLPFTKSAYYDPAKAYLVLHPGHSFTINYSG